MDTAEGQAREAERGWSLARGAAWIAERPVVVLLAVVAVAMALNLWETRGQTFFSDEWSRFLYADRSLEDLLRGHSGHLVFLNTALYKVLLHVFGAHSYAPFRVVEALLLGASGLLFYALARSMASPWPSVAATLVLLFLGSAVEVTATPYGIVILLPVSLGLAALVSMKWVPRVGDALACVLLAAAVFAHSDGLAFLAGATVILILEEGRRFLSRIWVVGVPALAYLAWTIWYHATATTTTQEVVHLKNVGLIPSTIVSVSSAGLSAISGLFGTTATGAFNLEAGYLLLGLLVVAAAWRIRRGPPVAREIWLPLTLALTFWALLGMVASPQRPPTASRYLYPTAVFLLLILLQLTRGLRVGRWAFWATIVALIVSLVPNVINLNEQAKKIREVANGERVELAGVELLRDEVPLESIPDLVRHTRLIGLSGTGFHFPATSYFNAVFRSGSPAASPQRIPLASEAVRKEVDGYLLRGRDLTLSDAPSGGFARQRTCRAATGENGVYPVPESGLVIRPQGSRSRLRVAARRFATSFEPLQVPAGSGPLVLRPGASQEVRPWQARISGAAVCRREAPA